MRLSTGEASVAEVAEPFDMSQPAISKHLKVLKKAGLISTAQSAHRRPRKMEAAPLALANAWIEGYRKFWERRYSALDELLGQLQAVPPKSKRKRHSETHMSATAQVFLPADTQVRDDAATSCMTDGMEQGYARLQEKLSGLH